MLICFVFPVESPIITERFIRRMTVRNKCNAILLDLGFVSLDTCFESDIYGFSLEEILVRIKDIFIISEVGLRSSAVAADVIHPDVDRWWIQQLFFEQCLIQSVFGYTR